MSDWIVGLLWGVLLINILAVFPWLCLTKRLRQRDDPRRSIVISNWWAGPMVAVIVGSYWWDALIGAFVFGIIMPHIFYVLGANGKLRGET